MTQNEKAAFAAITTIKKQLFLIWEWIRVPNLWTFWVLHEERSAPGRRLINIQPRNQLVTLGLAEKSSFDGTSTTSM